MEQWDSQSMSFLDYPVSDITPLTVIAVCVNHMKHINTLHEQNSV